MRDNKIFVASGNKGKIREISELLDNFGYKILSTNDISLEEPEENGASFIENALIKADYYFDKTKITSLADDSGLCVDALGGAPGIYSARYAEGDFIYGMKKLEKELVEAGIDYQKDKIKIKAHFVCALAFVGEDVKTGKILRESFEGKVFGKLVFPMKGENGFGYDAIFVPEGYNETFGEMSPEFKHSISHRANAFRLFKEFIK